MSKQLTPRRLLPCARLEMAGRFIRAWHLPASRRLIHYRAGYRQAGEYAKCSPVLKALQGPHSYRKRLTLASSMNDLYEIDVPEHYAVFVQNDLYLFERLSDGIRALLCPNVNSQSGHACCKKKRNIVDALNLFWSSSFNDDYAHSAFHETAVLEEYLPMILTRGTPTDVRFRNAAGMHFALSMLTFSQAPLIHAKAFFVRCKQCGMRPGRPCDKDKGNHKCRIDQASSLSLSALRRESASFKPS